MDSTSTKGNTQTSGAGMVGGAAIADTMSKRAPKTTAKAKAAVRTVGKKTTSAAKKVTKAAKSAMPKMKAAAARQLSMKKSTKKAGKKAAKKPAQKSGKKAAKKKSAKGRRK